MALLTQPSLLASQGTLTASETSAMIRMSVNVERWWVTTVPAESTTVSTPHATLSRPDCERIART